MNALTHCPHLQRWRSHLYHLVWCPSNIHPCSCYLPATAWPQSVSRAIRPLIPHTSPSPLAFPTHTACLPIPLLPPTHIWVGARVKAVIPSQPLSPATRLLPPTLVAKSQGQQPFSSPLTIFPPAPTHPHLLHHEIGAKGQVALSGLLFGRFRRPSGLARALQSKRTYRVIWHRVYNGRRAGRGAGFGTGSWARKGHCRTA